MKRLNLAERESRSTREQRQIVRQVVNSYHDWLTRTYSNIRFHIIPLRFLEEISQYIPERGNVLDLGCGFGLFSLFLALSHPGVQVTGVDISENRINMARRSAQELGVKNVQFHAQDIRGFDVSAKYDLVITLDLLHHIPYTDGNLLLEKISQWLAPEGIFLMKDITTRPRGMLYFTFLLDLLMNPKDAFYYRDMDTWVGEATKVGFQRVEQHYMWDILPYPHILLICRK